MADWQNAPMRYAVVRRPVRTIEINLHPVVAGALALVFIALLAWSGATTSYALFRDEFLMQIVARHSAAERVSSAEIARLRAEVQRASSMLLVEREDFASKLEVLSRRQADAERRQRLFSTLNTDSAPLPEDGPDDGLRLGKEARNAAPSGIRPDAASLSERYDELERDQKAALAGLKGKIEAERDGLAAIYSDLGLLSLPAAPVKAAMGGLYIPFEIGMGRTSDDVADLETVAAESSRLRAALDRIPLRSPTPGMPLSSGFGTRTDPFLGTLAFHSGLDLVAGPGTAARATAAGTVVSAGWNGNYGLMVELQHDHGYTTRYAHLSSVEVSPGQTVNTGDIIGRTGSTGRSTGPHLHYETRLNDVALDPRKFLKAGEKLN